MILFISWRKDTESQESKGSRKRRGKGLWIGPEGLWSKVKEGPGVENDSSPQTLIAKTCYSTLTYTVYRESPTRFYLEDGTKGEPERGEDGVVRVFSYFFCLQVTRWCSFYRQGFTVDTGGSWNGISLFKVTQFGDLNKLQSRFKSDGMIRWNHLELHCSALCPRLSSWWIGKYKGFECHNTYMRLSE